MNLFFDLDGTISDPFEGIAKSINHALVRMGHGEEELDGLSKYIGPSLTFTFEELLGTDDEKSIADAIAFYRERYFAIGFKENELYNGINKLLEDFQRFGHSQFIVTSKRKDIAGSVIDYFGIGEFFDSIYGCGLRVSKSELIGRILTERQIDPNETVMIGDRKFDIAAGLENGLKTIGVLWGYGSEEELRNAGATAVVRTIDELGNRFLPEETAFI